MHTTTPSANRLSSSCSGGATFWFLAIIAIATLAAWWYYAPNSLPDVVRTVVPESPKANPALYKWRDAKGRWNVTDVPPTDRPYETLKYDPKTNVVPNVAPLPSQTH
jgi:Domain of unknown function (DUF4124)